MSFLLGYVVYLPTDKTLRKEKDTRSVEILKPKDFGAPFIWSKSRHKEKPMIQSMWSKYKSIKL